MFKTLGHVNGFVGWTTWRPPERFEASYQLAGKGGLKRTAHSSEHAPVVVNTTTRLDLLGCDRIDHGYFVMEAALKGSMTAEIDALEKQLFGAA